MSIATPWQDRRGALAPSRLRAADPPPFDIDRDGLARAGLVGLAALIPLQRAAIIGAFGSVVMVLALLVVPVALWAGWQGRDRRALLTSPLLFAVALAWWGGATALWAVEPGAASSGFFRLLTMVALAAAVLYFAREETLRLRLLRAYLLGSLVAGSIVIYQYLTTPTVARASISPDASVNQVAFTLVLAMVPAAYLLARALQRGGPAAQAKVIAYGAAYSTLTVAVLLSGSRSGALLSVIATAAAILMIVVGTKSLLAAAQGITSILFLAVALMSALSLTDAPPLERILEVDRGGIQGEARAVIWGQAWEISADRPMAGTGLGLGVSFDEPGYSHEARNVHNTHLQVFLELGAVGTILWLLLIGGVFRAAWQAPGLERLMWASQLAVVFLGIGTRGFLFGVPMWFFIGIAAAIGLGSYRAGSTSPGRWA